MNLLIYNPDTDYALASGSDFYTPPASVIALMASDPYRAAEWGKAGDIILLTSEVRQSLDSSLDFKSNGGEIPSVLLAGDKFSVVSDDELQSNPELLKVIENVLPWGWNPALRHRLISIGVDESLLPDKSRIDHLRNLSHRRTTIDFLRMMGSHLLPREIFSEDEGIAFWKQNPGCWFKAPWSSSGRGILPTEELEERHIRPWLRGIVRRQGSVMAEKGIDKKIDFASEWDIDDSGVRFLGYSFFEVSGRGKYKGNVIMNQTEMKTFLDSSSNGSIDGIIAVQKEILNQLIRPGYRGPLGIDMIIDHKGIVHPCVEINLRRTMGHLSIL